MTSNASSTVPAVMSVVVPGMKAVEAGANTQVEYGDTARVERYNTVFTGDARWDDEMWSSLGHRDREEIYRLDGFVQVRVPGHTQQQALEACYGLLAAVERYLRTLVGSTDAGLTAALSAAHGPGNSQVTNLEFKPVHGWGFETLEGRGYHIDFAIRVTARI